MNNEACKKYMIINKENKPRVHIYLCWQKTKLGLFFYYLSNGEISHPLGRHVKNSYFRTESRQTCQTENMTNVVTEVWWWQCHNIFFCTVGRTLTFSLEREQRQKWGREPQAKLLIIKLHRINFKSEQCPLK